MPKQLTLFGPGPDFAPHKPRVDRRPKHRFTADCIGVRIDVGGPRAAFARYCKCDHCCRVRVASAQRNLPPDKWHNQRRDVDEVAVERALSGDRPASLTLGERYAVTAELTRHGHSATTIAARVGVTPRQVIRYRARLKVDEAA